MSARATISQLKVDISYRQIIRISAPISLAMLVPQVNMVINNVFLGNLGEKELGAAPVPMVYYLSFAVMGHGWANGVQSLFSRRAGEGNAMSFGPIFTHAALIKVFFAFAGIAFTFILAPLILNKVIQNPVVAAESIKFAQIRIWGLPFLYILLLCNALFISANRSQLLIIVTTIEALFNVLFDWAMIFGHLGFPAMGFYGAAYASVAAEAIGMLLALGILFGKGFHKKFAITTRFRYQTKVVFSIIRQSAPLVFQHFISVGSWLFFFIFIVDYGQRATAVSNIMRNLFGIYGIFIWSFAQTTNSMVSNIIGQGLEHRVMELVKKIIITALICTVFLGLLLNLFPAFFLGIYGQGTEFMTDAIPVIQVLSFATLIMSPATIFLNTVTGTGNTRVNLQAEALAILAYMIYIWWVTHILHAPLTIAWASEILYWTIIISVCYAYIKSGKWKGKVI